MFLSGSGGRSGWLAGGSDLVGRAGQGGSDPVIVLARCADKNTKIIHPERSPGTLGKALDKNTKIINPEPATGVGPTKSLCS